MRLLKCNISAFKLISRAPVLVGNPTNQSLTFLLGVEGFTMMIFGDEEQQLKRCYLLFVWFFLCVHVLIFSCGWKPISLIFLFYYFLNLRTSNELSKVPGL